MQLTLFEWLRRTLLFVYHFLRGGVMSKRKVQQFETLESDFVELGEPRVLDLTEEELMPR
jgi:hypothetical protein